MNQRQYLQSFIIGSSMIATIISFSYIGLAFKKSKRHSSIPYELFPIFIPIMFGIFNIINVYLQRKYKTENISFFVGALMGVIFSLIGRFGLDLPKKMFKFTNKNEYYVHIIAFFLYGLIFKFVLQFFNIYFHVIPTKFNSAVIHPASL